ncbi:MAG: hypothetical protein NPMRTH1_400016 [Nitrosopumilales archaeon]|nr:MAG: hypothetical protein NPMRTH1_400016 [Nitrosopumilales archaeon]
MSNIQILTNWEEYAPIKKWKNGLKYNSHKNRLSPKTLQAIRIWMPSFIEYTQKNPDEIIEEALKGKEIVKARLSDFCTWAQDVKGKKFNASVHGAYHIIRGFYAHNDINTQKIRTPKVEPSEVQFTDDNVPLFDIIEVEKSDGTKEKQKRIKRDFIKNFLECLSPRDKIICMCIKDSGMDGSDILDLTLKTVRYQDPSSKRIFIRGLRNKTGEIIATFFSQETTKLLRNYVQLHRKNANDDEAIFVQSAQESKVEFHKKHKRRFEPTIDKLELHAVDPHYLSKCFRIATQKLEKLLSTSEKPVRILQRNKQSPLRPKRFRKLFNDVCDGAGIPTDIKRVFMGKSDPANKVYEGKSRQDLELYFEKIEPKLTIYSEPRNESDLIEIKRLREELEKAKQNQLSDIQQLRHDMDKKLQDQQDQFHYFVKQQDKLKKK